MPTYTIGKKVVQRFHEAGYIAFFAGGWVRDYLMKHPSNDIDIATNAPINVTQKLFTKTIPVGINFGILIIVEEGHHFEVATFRKESDYKDGRRPERVFEATPKEDALRRDFTINGMFFDPLKEKLYDFVGGENDLKNEIIRAIGNPHDRFLEDRLRMIRAVRYASRFRFAIEPSTLSAIINHAGDLFPAVAIERVSQEFEKMNKDPHFNEALLMMHRLGLLGVIFPSLFSLSLEDLEKRVILLPHFPKETPFIIKLYELFPTFSLEDKLSLCDYLKLSSEAKKVTYELDLWENKSPCDLYEWVKLYALDHASMALQIMSLKKNSKSFLEKHLLEIQKQEKAILRMRHKKTLVSSLDLIARGIKSGKRMGEILALSERIAINEGILDASQVLKKIPPSFFETTF